MTHPRQQFVSEKDTVAVYTINVDHEPRTVVDYKEFNYKDGLDDYFENYDVSRGELTTHMNESIETELARVESITEGYTPKGYPYRDYITKSFYIIEPRLEKIVSAKYKNKIRTLEEVNNTLGENLSAFMEDCVKLSLQIDKYNNLPWWKKLFTFKI